jgi:hypothetical protein
MHVLDDNYSTQYHDDSDYDDEDDDGPRLDHAYSYGYDEGYVTALHRDCYDDTIDPDSDYSTIAVVDELVMAYRTGYQKGYDAGVGDRS